MTEETFHACRRLGVSVYLRSARTGRVWEVLPDIEASSKYAAKPLSPDDRCLSSRQVAWHLTNRPDNFFFDLPTP